MKAPAGAVVSLYVDLCRPVQRGHVIETQTGRQYGVLSVRVQMRGAHSGRQHLKCLVLSDEDEVAPSTIIHRIRWYKRAAKRR